jgi:hypothetical protein
MNMKMVLRAPCRRVNRQRNGAVRHLDPRFRVIKLRDCHASQKKFGV